MVPLNVLAHNFEVCLSALLSPQNACHKRAALVLDVPMNVHMLTAMCTMWSGIYYSNSAKINVLSRTSLRGPDPILL